MADRIAIKKLSASDCTLFEAVFRNIGAGNEKSINLNADVLVDDFYPNLAALAALTDNEIAMSLSLYGPDGKPAYKIARKIIKNATYKNWRLNGEFIFGPPEDPSRYDGVQPGDLAVMKFTGDTAPNGLTLILANRTEVSDVSLHKALESLFGTKSMIAVTPTQVAQAANFAAVPETHPIYVAAADPALESMLEDAAQGGLEGANKLLANKSTYKTSPADLAKAKARAEITGRRRGRIGECLPCGETRDRGADCLRLAVRRKCRGPV